MKRLLSFLLALVILSSCAVIFASATGTTDSTDKLDDALKTKLETAKSDDVLDVWVWLVGVEVSEQKLVQLTYEECGFSIYGGIFEGIQYSNEEERRIAERERMDLYTSTKTRIASELTKKHNETIIAELGIDKADISFLSVLSPSFVASLSKQTILSIIESKSVASVSYYEQKPTDQPTEKSEMPTGMYRYFSKDNHTDIPDWILFDNSDPSSGIGPAPCYGVYGDFIITQVDHYGIHYLLYFPGDNSYSNLAEAFNDKIPGIEEAFTKCMLLRSYIGATYIGDADGDRALTIMDATFIQKAIAKLCNFSNADIIYGLDVSNSGFELSYISDFDRDGERTISDATQIQKKLANIN